MRRLWFICLICLCLIPHPAKSQAQDNPPQLGTNLAAVVSYSPQWPFVDVFKTAREWISQCEGCEWGAGEPLDLTPDGWPATLAANQWAETIMLDSGSYPAGIYTLLYEGEGTIEFRLNSATIISQADGQMLVEPSGHDGLFLAITATNPANPIRNIRLIMPDFADSYTERPFHPLFLERLEAFSVLRFMDWMATNNSEIRTWQDRPLPTDATWGTDKGVPLEVMVQLANTLQADAWFTMPHLADDEYIREFATYTRDHLDPALKVYIEYSNETWNSIFSQAHYVIEQGRALNLSDNDFQAGLFYHSQRAVEIFKIWEGVFGGTERLVRVLAAQGANAWTGEQVISFNKAYEQADALAIAPYFGGSFGSPENVSQTLNLTPDTLIEALQVEIQTDIKTWIEDNLNITEAHQLSLIAYEGGQHLVGVAGMENNDTLTALFHATNRQPAMYTLYMDYLTQWHRLGGGLFVNFSSVDTFTKWGSWGVLEYQDQPLDDAPKYRALLDYVGAKD